MTENARELLKQGIVYYNYAVRRYNYESTPGNEIKVHSAQKYLNGMVCMIHALTGVEIKFEYSDISVYSIITGYIEK